MNHTFKKIAALMLAVCLLTASGCSFTQYLPGSSKLTVGTEDLSNTFNPFYTDREENGVAMAQLFERIQRQGNGNKLQNVCGSITYEYLDNGQVKYTVSLNEGVRYSDGTYATVDDIIFYYTVLSDASYDGPFADWMDNDLVGLKAFYYDDAHYEEKLDNIEETVLTKYSKGTISAADEITYLVATNLNGKYAEGDGKDWGAYCEKYGYGKEYKALGKKPSSEKVLKLLARVEAESNPDSYDPAAWWRQNLIDNYIQKNYADGVDVPDVSGIVKVNDHCCTLLFDSANVNTISLINPLIVPKSVYGTGYQKGSCDVVRRNEPIPVGSGPFVYEKYDTDNNELSLTGNPYYHGGEPAFHELKIVNIADRKGSALSLLKSGKVDVFESDGAESGKDAYNEDGLQSFFTHSRCYYAFTFNAEKMSENKRKAVMKVVNCQEEIKAALGDSYTALNYPMSLRFGEYPTAASEPFYKLDVSGAKKLLVEDGIVLASANGKATATNEKGKPVTLKVACCGDENSLPFAICGSVKNALAAIGIGLTVKCCTDKEYLASLKNGDADFWCGPVNDGLTCDCYDRFGTGGKSNDCRISDFDLDGLLNGVRNANDYEARCAMTRQMLDSVMEIAVILPLYQPKTVTVYNTDVVDASSLGFDTDPAGCRYMLHTLIPA